MSEAKKFKTVKKPTPYLMSGLNNRHGKIEYILLQVDQGIHKYWEKN
jgi:hypothetical protein